jgi:hypothetical protein
MQTGDLGFDPRMGHIHEGSRTATAGKSISAVEILTMVVRIVRERGRGACA